MRPIQLSAWAATAVLLSACGGEGTSATTGGTGGAGGSTSTTSSSSSASSSSSSASSSSSSASSSSSSASSSSSSASSSSSSGTTGTGCPALCTAANAGSCTTIKGDCTALCDAIDSLTPPAGCAPMKADYLTCLDTPATVCQHDCSLQLQDLRACLGSYCAGDPTDPDCQTLKSSF